MPTRTSKQPLSRERILDAARAIADSDGLEAVTMRRVADHLACEAMSLYYYVKDKQALLRGLTEVIVDEVIATTMDPDLLRGADGWRETIRRRCLAARRVMLKHPWAPALIATSAYVPGNSFVIFEGLVGTMADAGFTYATAHRAIHALGSMLMGFAQEIFEPGGSSDGATTSEEMEAMAAHFPHLMALAATEPHDQQDALSVCDTQAEFEFTLNLILDGLERARAEGA